jgi:diguanylate cyclase (GGDEF)-like protein
MTKEKTKVVKTAGGEFRAATEIFIIIILVAIAAQILAPWCAEHFPYFQINFLNIKNEDWWEVNLIAMLSAPIIYYRAHTRWQKSKLVWELANTDHLTGLYNRRYLLESMERELELADRFDDYSVGLLMIDIDNFKKVNDTYGHSIGDEVIKFVAHTLQTRTRTYCISSRYGGEEFVQIIPKSDIEQTRNAATNLLKTINAETRIYDGHPIQVSVSIGVAVIPNCATSVNEWLDQADHAMYLSKANGKNRVTIFGEDLYAL